MKTIYSILFMMLVPIFVQAQYTLTAEHNLPRAGEVIIKQQVEWKDPGREGKNVLWDFSELQPVNEHYKLTYSTTNDSIFTGTEHHTMYRYGFRDNTLLLWGYENNTTIYKNQQPEELMKFPLGYRDKNTSYYYGQGKYSEFLALSVVGSIYWEGDASGTLILPNGDTLTNALRVRTVKKIAERTTSLPVRYKLETPVKVSEDSIRFRLKNDTTILMLETYRWYGEGYRYPVFETVRSYIGYKNKNTVPDRQTAFFFHPQEQQLLGEDQANRQVLQTNNSFKSSSSKQPTDQVASRVHETPGDLPGPVLGSPYRYNVFPNPVSRELQLELSPSKDSPVEVMLFDLQGKLLYRWAPANEGGIIRLSIPMTRLPKGEYILRLVLGEETLNEKIIKS